MKKKQRKTISKKKNDVSFLLSSIMNLFEHQSTFNPNMPVRGLLYLARIYQNYIRENGLNIYSSTQIPLPVPVYVVFYNSSGKYQIQSGKKSSPE